MVTGGLVVVDVEVEMVEVDVLEVDVELVSEAEVVECWCCMWC